MESDVIVAIDFGTTKVAMAVAKKESDGHLKVLGFETKPLSNALSIRNGVIARPTDVAGVVEELNKLMNNRIADSRLKLASTFISIGGRSLHSEVISKSLSFDVPTEILSSTLEMLKEQVKKTLVGSDIVYNFWADSYIIDGIKVNEPLGEVCTSLTANYIAVVGMPLIKNNIEKTFDRNRLKVESYQFAPLCCATAVLQDSDKEQGCLLIDFGASTTSFVVYHQSKLVTAEVVPFGSAHVTSDLMKMLELKEHEAEELKKSQGVALADAAPNVSYRLPSSTLKEAVKAQEMAQIIQARIDEILSLIWLELKRIGLDKELKAGVIITGGGSKMLYLPELIEMRLGMKVTQGQQNKWLTNNNFSALLSPEYAQLVGQLLMGDSNCVSTIEIKVPKIEEVKKPEEPQKIEKESKPKKQKRWGLSFFDTTSPVDE